VKRFKSFRMSETTYNQISSLPEELQLRYYTAVCNYGINGVEPDFTGIERSVWIPMKDLIDYSNDRSRINKENGKKGGAPEGNNNRKKAKSTNINQIQPKVADVIQEAKENGFFIDTGTAQDFLECGLDASWLIGPHSFMEFVAEKVNEKYEEKPNGEKKAIFISAVKSASGAWDDLRNEYPDWKSLNEEQDKKKAKKAAVEEARKNHPKKCDVCGKDVTSYNDAYYCRACSRACEFNKETLEWEWKEW